MKLRKATLDDAQRLFDWRNDPTCREASHNTQPLIYSEHLAWLSRSLAMPSRTIYIAEVDSTPVGMVRADATDGVTELSWLVATEWRGSGLGKRIVSMIVSMTEGELRAQIKAANFPSIAIATHAGLRLEREGDGVLHFSRPPR
jgi:RimJ/RimL family protein N-acetyltransferase